MKKYITAFLFIFFLAQTIDSPGQYISLLHEKKGVSLRGLSAVNEKVVWVSGNKGTIGRSVDGGKSWEWLNPASYQQRDFRDIEAFDKHTALAMAVGEPAIIIKTEDGGKRWKAVYTNETPGMFLDAMEFWNEQSGIVIGDPVQTRFFVARTFDGGSNWRALDSSLLPRANTGEACFAASGTNVRALDRDEACFVSGGKSSRFFWKGEPVDLPLLHGKETQGANSVAIWYKQRKEPVIVVAGGDFADETNRAGNLTISVDGGKSWFPPAKAPNGYRSCVEFISKKRLISCGINGVDLSTDTGHSWTFISDTGFHVCRKAKKGKSVFLAGGDGRIGKLVEQ